MSEKFNNKIKPAPEHWAYFMEWNPNPIIELDLAGNIQFLNLAARIQFPNLSIDQINHPILAPLKEKLLPLANSDNELIVLSQEIDFANRKYSQEIFAIPEKKSIFINMIDITERIMYEQKIQEFNKELEQRITERTEQLNLAKEIAEKLARKAKDATLAKSAFLATMSHEIRTPLNGVIGMTGLLLDSPLSIEQREFAETIKLSGEVLLAIINDILDFSKIESGHMEIENSDFDVRLLINDAIEIISAQTHGKQIGLTTFVEPEIPKYLIGDSSKIRQVLNNFLSNAVKFTEQGEVNLYVKQLSPKLENGQVKLFFTVRDTGIGISQEMRKHLFQPFSQGDNSTSRKFGGTGLGLAICKHLIEMMGGKIILESTPGQGSQFSFELTLPESTGINHINASQPTTIDHSNAKDYRILLAEDNAINQQVTLRILSKLGYRANAVANGLEVLQAIKEIPYDLILMDCHMPEMDGYVTTMEIRKLEKMNGEKHIPIIAMTANALKGDRDKCLAAGMDDYISKPIELKTLENVLQRILQK